MLIDKIQSNLSYEARVTKQVYTLVKSVLERKVLYFPRLKIFYFKNSSYQLLGELSIRLIGLTELTNSVRKNLQDFQLNTKVVQQSDEDQPSLDQVEILNVSCEKEGESSLNILLKEVLAADAAEETAVIGNESDRVLRY